MTTQIILPNIRKLFIPDPGYVMFEADLKGADGWVVAWESEEEEFKETFRKLEGKVHAHNAEAMWGSEFTKLEGHARDFKLQECKHTVHGIHYGCSPRTTAIQRGWLVSEAERFHRRWLSLHPGVERYHNRVRESLQKNRTIFNAFGFRRVFFDRIDNCFTEALAWIPQSTVAINTYHGALQLEAKYWPEQQRPGFSPSRKGTLYPYEGILLQTHDSINPQFHLARVPPIDEIRKTLEVVTPYPDPLVIPWDLKRSTKSWGDMVKC